MSAKGTNQHQHFGLTGSFEVSATREISAQNLNFPATLNTREDTARPTEPCRLLAALGPEANETGCGAAPLASFRGRRPAAGFRPEGPGAGAAAAQHGPGSGSQEPGPPPLSTGQERAEGRPVGRRPTGRAGPGRRPHYLRMLCASMLRFWLLEHTTATRSGDDGMAAAAPSATLPHRDSHPAAALPREQDGGRGTRKS